MSFNILTTNTVNFNDIYSDLIRRRTIWILVINTSFITKIHCAKMPTFSSLPSENIVWSLTKRQIELKTWKVLWIAFVERVANLALKIGGYGQCCNERKWFLPHLFFETEHQHLWAKGSRVYLAWGYENLIYLFYKHREFDATS